MIACGKKTYATRGEAWRHLAAIVQRYRRDHRTKGGGPTLLEVYECRFCRSWHIGRPFATSKQREDLRRLGNQR
jgi:hypothetical protein